ncbi:MAG: hypothetical protein Kow0042_03460 [Calditrichia bacterium]
MKFLQFSVDKLVYFFLSSSFVCFLLFILTCASSNLSRLERLHNKEQYQEIIRAGIDCDNSDPSCFTIKYILADSYFHIGDTRTALQYVQDALLRVSPQIPEDAKLMAYLLKADILFEESKNIFDFELKRKLTKRVEEALHKLIKTGKELPLSGKKLDSMFRAHSLLAEVILIQMDLTPADSLEWKYQEMGEVIAELKKYSFGEGYDIYYDLIAKFKLVLPQVKRYVNQGIGDQQNLKLVLDKIYRVGTSLKDLPIYSHGHETEIDYFLEKVIEYRNKLD